MKNYSRILALCCVCGIMLYGCNQPTADNSATAEAAIRSADSTWATLATPPKVDAFIATFTDDAVMMPPNQETASGKEAINKLLHGLFSMPGFGVKWQLLKVEGAKSGEMGTAYGTFEMTMNDSTGAVMTDKGRFVNIWRKQADGNWKATYEMFNSSMPAGH